MGKASSRTWLAGPILAFLYFLAGWGAYRIRILSGMPAVFWFSNGMALAGLMWVGLRFWPWIALGSVLFQVSRGLSWESCAFLLVGNLLGPILGVYFLRMCGPPREVFDTVRGVFRFLFLAACLASSVGAIFEVMSIAMDRGLPFDAAASIWMGWWVDEALGIVLVTPLVVLAGDLFKRRFWRNTTWDWQFFALLLCTLFVGLASYSPLARFNPTILIRAYLLFPLIIWAAFQFGLLGASMVISITAACIVSSLLQGFIPALIKLPIPDQVLLQKGLIFSLGMTGMVVAAAIREKEEALKTRDSFLSLASHELRTPLTTLKLQMQLRKRMVQAGDHSLFRPELLASLVEKDERQIHRLTRLLEDMFDISRLNSGKFSLQKTQVDLRELVRDTVARFSPQLQNTGCELRFMEKEDAPIQGHWDQHCLEQVISNLLVNASKYGQGKPIEVEVDQVGSKAHLTVKDQGIGIAEEDQDRIFKPYERAVSSDEVSGLGLGLYISSEIIKAHGGRISVRSSPKQGSTFSVELPIDS